MSLRSSTEVGGRLQIRSARAQRFRRRAAVLCVFALCAVGAVPAAAQFGFLNPAAWATVIKMKAVVGQMVSVKRQVENVRNMARSAALGAFAPMVEGLKPVTDAVNRTRDAIRTPMHLTQEALNRNQRGADRSHAAPVDPLQRRPQAVSAGGGHAPAHHPFGSDHGSDGHLSAAGGGAAGLRCVRARFGAACAVCAVEL